MAAVGGILPPPGGAPLPQQAAGVAEAPQLPFGPDPGSITGWVLQETSSLSTDETLLSFEPSFA
jgi:hypothetical protein